jgi:hypothetical protein
VCLVTGSQISVAPHYFPSLVKWCVYIHIYLIYCLYVQNISELCVITYRMGLTDKNKKVHINMSNFVSVQTYRMLKLTQVTNSKIRLNHKLSSGCTSLSCNKQNHVSYKGMWLIIPSRCPGKQNWTLFYMEYFVCFRSQNPSYIVINDIYYIYTWWIYICVCVCVRAGGGGACLFSPRMHLYV